MNPHLTKLLVLVGALPSTALGQPEIAVPSDTLYREAAEVVIQGESKCDNLIGRYKYRANQKDGLVSIDLWANGTRLSEAELNRLKAELLISGGFDYISFSCSNNGYIFSFIRSKDSEIVSSIHKPQ